MGYYHWTLTDNFEWAEGWNLRFGLVKLNPETQERTLRRSGELYGEMARLNAIDDETGLSLHAGAVRDAVSGVKEVVSCPSAGRCALRA